jgi:hypothetical protein
LESAREGKGGGSASSSTAASSSSASSASAGGSGGAGGTGGSGGTGGVAGSCEPGTELVYVLSDDSRMYRFDPPKKQFNLVGPLKCPTNMRANSMAVDRSGNAWINYVAYDNNGDIVGGALFKTSIENAACDPSSSPLPAGWYKLGMGFTADKPMQAGETLYLNPQASASVGWLGRIDNVKGTLVPIAKFGPPFQNEGAELTGNANAELFAFFADSGSLAQIAPDSAKVLSNVKLPIGQIGAYAFSFWGGDFYIYTSPPQGNSSNVTRYQPSTKSTSLYMQNVGFNIVGAGVAICAPTKS